MADLPTVEGSGSFSVISYTLKYPSTYLSLFSLSLPIPRLQWLPSSSAAAAFATRGSMYPTEDRSFLLYLFVLVLLVILSPVSEAKPKFLLSILLQLLSNKG